MRDTRARHPHPDPAAFGQRVGQERDRHLREPQARGGAEGPDRGTDTRRNQ